MPLEGICRVIRVIVGRTDLFFYPGFSFLLNEVGRHSTSVFKSQDHFGHRDRDFYEFKIFSCKLVSAILPLPPKLSVHTIDYFICAFNLDFNVFYWS